MHTSLLTVCKQFNYYYYVPFKRLFDIILKPLLQCFSHGWLFKSSQECAHNQRHCGEKRKFSVNAHFRLSVQLLRSQTAMSMSIPMK